MLNNATCCHDSRALPDDFLVGSVMQDAARADGDGTGSFY